MQMWLREGHTRGRWVEAEATGEAEATRPRGAISIRNFTLFFSIVKFLFL